MKTIIVAGVFLLFATQTACFRKAVPQAQTNLSSEIVGSAEANRAEARTLLAKGRELYRDDEDAQALEAFQQAAKLDPELPEVHFRLGLAYDALGQEQEAEGAYKQAVETYKKYLVIDENEKDPEAHYNLGQTYSGLHLYSEAVREYRQATKLKPDDAAIYYDLGLALMRLAQYDEAAAAFSKSLELDPQNYRAEDSLAEAKEGVDRIRSGKKHQEDLLKKKKEEELKKQEEGGETPVPKNVNARKPV
ncbi:MAG TPA: tetratricopeptide repeat protein [Pyrinomonadaceae bacterium]|nr:tetratricopeptide repeat protein [Pyrinomonadaceae bacterium]